MGLSSAAMRYLLVIYELSDGGKPVRSVDIARALEVSPASVVHMMGVLAGEGLVLKRHYGQVQLTAEGIRASNQLYTKCTILESFLLQELDVDEGVIHAVVSHGWGLCSDVKPESLMERYLFAADELTGLIGAAALMRPTGLEGMEVKSVMKKFKDKKFAAGCSREVISQGAQLLGLTVQELIGEVLPAMQAMPPLS